MQRNRHILKNTNMKSGMAMILAIAFLLVVAGIIASMQSMTAISTKRTEHIYFTEQAQLLAKSATEFAMLAISGHNRIGESCVQTINSTFPNAATPIFTIVTNIRYIGMNPIIVGSTCDNNSYIDIIATAQSQGTVLVDVTVTSTAQLGLAENIVYHRRTLQKP